MVSYPPTYLKNKADDYAKEIGENGKPASDSKVIIDALSFFLKHRHNKALAK